MNAEWNVCCQTRRSAGLAVWLATAALASADLKPALCFGDNMVLQRQMPVPVWGTADPGETVTVSVARQAKSAVTTQDGAWRVCLDPMEASSEPQSLGVQGGGESVGFTNVLIGEVWLCSGQSNMEWPVKDSLNGTSEVRSANFPAIRVKTKKVGGSWRPAVGEAVANFSATAYFFGRNLHQSLDVPVGLVVMSVGGTSIRRWTPAATLKAEPDLWEHFNDRPLREYAERQKAFDAAGGLVDPLKNPAPRKPSPPGDFYDAFIRPFAPFAMRGILWYQGENDVRTSDRYARVLPLMINAWRAERGQPDLPFLFVQLPGYAGKGFMPDGLEWAWMREAQARALAVPNTAMAVALDLGERNNIHPRNKQDVGLRLSLLALRNVYGQDVVDQGPQYESAVVQGDRIRLTFAESSSPPRLAEGAPGFAISGADRRFVPARVMWEGADLWVWNEGIKNPVAVRYGWVNAPEAGLFNAKGLPAAPFRTDDWPVETTSSNVP